MHQPALQQKFQEASARAALNQMIKQGEGKPSGQLFHGAETQREIGVSRAMLRAAALSCAQKIVRLAKDR
jgi:DNA-binding FadR family transcriptional regulator